MTAVPMTAVPATTVPTNTGQTDGANPGAELDESQQPGFSQAELLYLLTTNPSPAADFSASVLGIDALDNAELLIELGASSLLAHRSLVFSEDSQAVVPQREALLLAYVLTSAKRWTTFGVVAADSGDSGFLIEADEGRVLAQPRALNTWWFIFLDTEASIDAIFADTATSLTVAGAETAVYAEIATLTDSRGFSLYRSNDEWSYAWGIPGDTEPKVHVDDATAAEVDTALVAFSADFPS